MPPPTLVLASASPRRVNLLRGIGLSPVVVPSGVPEDLRPGEVPRDHALRLAEDKARHVAAANPADAVVLGADTVVTLDGRILGKPRDSADAKEMLRFLSGRDHEVLTGVFLLRLPGGVSAGTVASTRVRFRSYDERLVSWYVATGEPLDKAGAYSIQGLGVLLCDCLDGSWSNVVGLPLEPLPSLFAQVGINLLDLINSPVEPGR